MADISAIAKISIHAPPRGATRSNEHGKRADYFNSRPSARGDVAVLGKRADTRRISIHAPPRGGDNGATGLVHLGFISIHAPPRGATRTRRRRQWKPLRQFQFTPLREGRPNGKYCVRNPALDFNSRPSARGDKKAADYGNKAINFNSRPSARGDEKIAKKCEKGLISIHAPPRGATRVLDVPRCADEISIHAPPRGATRAAVESARRDEISIHAPPRGATSILLHGVIFKSFQFTPLREGRLGWCIRFRRCTLFQFTPLREGRRHIATNPAVYANFNSRPSARGDAKRMYWNVWQCDFNSRPSARGDMTRIGMKRAKSLHFNSRPSARGDNVPVGLRLTARIFQFTPLREGRREI